MIKMPVSAISSSYEKTFSPAIKSREEIDRVNRLNEELDSLENNGRELKNLSEFLKYDPLLSSPGYSLDTIFSISSYLVKAV